MNAHALPERSSVLRRGKEKRGVDENKHHGRAYRCRRFSPDMNCATRGGITEKPCRPRPSLPGRGYKTQSTASAHRAEMLKLRKYKFCQQ